MTLSGEIRISELPLGSGVKLTDGVLGIFRFKLISHDHHSLDPGYPESCATLWSETTAGTAANNTGAITLAESWTLPDALQSIIVQATVGKKTGYNAYADITARKYPIGSMEAGSGSYATREQAAFPWLGSDAERIRSAGGTTVPHRTRDKHAGSSTAAVRDIVISSGGAVTFTATSPEYDVFPLLNIPEDTMVSPAPGADGYYILRP